MEPKQKAELNQKAEPNQKAELKQKAEPKQKAELNQRAEPNQEMEPKQKAESDQKLGISGSTLKIIAMVTMLIDHIGAGFIENGLLPYLTRTYGMKADIVNTWSVIDTVMRCIGRMAFPIFCFLIVEGYYHTRDIKKYLGRLLLFAIISEVPFDLAFLGRVWDTAYQNVYFSLFLGLLAITICDRVKLAGGKQGWLSAVALVGLGIIATVMSTDYMFVAVLLIYVFYVFRQQEPVRDIVGAVTLLGAGKIEIAGYVAFLPMHFYNGERGLKLKYVFYLFYPVHILVIALIRIAVFGA